MNKSTIENNEEALRNNLSKFMDNMMKIDNYFDVIPRIIKLHFEVDNKDDLIANLHMHISEMINSDANILFEYLSYGRTLEIKEFQNKGKYKRALECINNIKIEYGSLIRVLYNGYKTPFIINSLQTNINNGDSTHEIKFSRADGKSLSGQFKPNILLPILSSLINSLKKSIENGVYNLNTGDIERFLHTSKEFNKFLESLLDKNKEESND